MNSTTRRWLWIGMTTIAASVGCRATGPGRTADRADWTFDEQTARHVPAGWTIAATKPTADLATWQLLDDTTAPSGPRVFALTRSANYDGTYNLAIADGPTFADLDLTLRAKAVAGSEDQGGGPIWRCQDANNYYICRFSPLESNFRVYVVADGKRRQLNSVKVELHENQWYEVHVRMVGNAITCELDGGHTLTATDDTIPRAGTVGLWTKADAVTSFDDLHVRAVAPAK